MENLVFRCLWTLNISVGDGGATVLEGIYLSTLLGVLEITRRFFWNFFRLENEHLNNCGAFRVIRDIAIHPLDPNDLVLNDEEEGVDPGLKKQLQEAKRKMSLTLQEVCGYSYKVSNF